MTREEFEKIVEEEFPRAVPEKFHHLIHNVGFLIEDEPGAQVRAEEGLRPNETLLGLYRGIPHSARGESYGIGATLPDTITLYRRPIEDEAAHLEHSNILQNVGMSYEEAVRKVIRETIWHEVAHYMGYDEHQVRGRESLSSRDLRDERKNDTL